MTEVPHDGKEYEAIRFLFSDTKLVDSSAGYYSARQMGTHKVCLTFPAIPSSMRTQYDTTHAVSLASTDQPWAGRANKADNLFTTAIGESTEEAKARLTREVIIEFPFDVSAKPDRQTTNEPLEPVDGFAHVPVPNGQYIIHPAPPARPNAENYKVEAKFIYWDLCFVVYRPDTGVLAGQVNRPQTAAQRMEGKLAAAMGAMNMGS